MQNGINNFLKHTKLITAKEIAILAMLALLLTFYTTVNAEEINDLPQALSVEEKQERLALFREKWAAVEELRSSGEVTLHEHLVKRMNKELDKESLSNLYFLQKYNRDGGYVVYLWYINNNSHPTLYGSSNKFEINEDKKFYESKAEEILLDYLDKHHEVVESNLKSVVNGIVCIAVKVHNVEQLEALLENPRISDFRHFEFYGTEELTF